jgi:hypothetical protein
MSTVSIDVAVEQILGAFKEGFEGPPPGWAYFSDRGTDAGFLALLGTLSAAEASRTTGGTTIAGHIQHLVFSCDVTSAFIKGDRSPRNWDESWSVKAVDEAGWARLRERLRAGYDSLRNAIGFHAAGSLEALGISVGAATHVAYHLGAVRQKLAFAKSK